jgi:ribonucleotide monophosphatase NagD (HAD superfamily)
VRGIVLDMEGVLHVDWSPIPGSPEAVAQLAAGGIELGVLTNTTGKTRAAIAERLAGIGYELPVGRITTAASPPPSTSAPNTRASACTRWSSGAPWRAGRDRAGR